MSKSILFYVAVIVGLILIVGARTYREHKQQLQLRQVEQEEQEAYRLARKPVAPVMQLPVFERFVDKEGTEIYLQDVQLSDALNKEQARQTLSSILDDYREDAALQAFYKDLRQSTGQSITLLDLSGDSMDELLGRYPQITQIIEHHGQNPAFSAVLQEIFSNPQYVRSVSILQRRD